MRKLFYLLALILITSSTNFAQKYDKRTPFNKVTYKNNDAYIEYQGKWQKLVSIEGKAITEYIKRAIEMEPTNWKKGFHRYLHYIMDDMKMERGKTVRVSFEQNGKILSQHYKLKKENRDLATLFHDKEIGKNRIKRSHTSEIPTTYSYLNTRLYGYKKTEKDWLSKKEVIYDLEHLEWQIVTNYSYANLKGFDYKLAIDAIIVDLNEGINKRDFALQLKMFMANFGDGHSSVSMGRYILTKDEKKKRLPFNIIKQNNIFYAINSNTHSFYKADYPQIISMNGVNMEKLSQIARSFIPKTTHKFVERNTVEYLNLSYFLTKIADKESKDEIEVIFSNGNKTAEETIRYGNYKKENALKRYYIKENILQNNLGYLALNQHMDSDNNFIDSIHLAMQNFRNTNALIIDIRGNGGGSRAPLRAVLPYLIKKPVICNIARFRIDNNKDIHPANGYFETRYSYPKNHKGYSKAEREAIVSFKKTFKPSRSVSDKKFTDYNYMVISPSDSQTGYYYSKPVIVLVDEGCFSASDIFAAGIRQGDHVKLLGNTTGGGSGFTASRMLPNSGIKIRMSRMFSYQPDGNIYDGHGVIPDIKVDYTLNDKLGKTDSQLEKAKEILKKQ